MKQVSKLVYLVVLAVFLIVTPAAEKLWASEATKIELTFGTAASGSSIQGQLIAIAKTIESHTPGIKIEVVESASAVPENAQRLSLGEIQLGHISEDEIFLQYNGIGKYEGKADKNVRILFTWKISAIPIVLRADSGITSVEGLVGKNFAWWTGTSTAALIDNCLETIGVKPNKIGGSLQDNVAAVVNNRAIGFAKTTNIGVADASILEAGAALKLNAVGFSESQAAAIQEKYPWIHFLKFPRSTVTGDKSDSEILTVPRMNLIVGTSANKISQDAGYQICKAVFGSTSELLASIGAFADFEPINGQIEYAVLDSAPFHPGLVQFLRENGISVPDELIPSEYKKD